jgi:hypothetical protein
MRTSLLPIFLALAASPTLATLGACTYTVKVEPIHLTVDVNIKIDRALDEFFAPPAPATATPATPAAPAK